MIKKNKPLQLFTLTFFCFLISFSGYAQEAAVTEEYVQDQNEEIVSSDPQEYQEDNIGIKDTIDFKGDKFRRANFQNMSKMFWNFGLPDIDNNEHIDKFFQINECELYKKYYGNEFEWGPLRETMRDYLRENGDKFSKQLYFDLPIEVGIYNVNKGNFAVLSENFNSAVRDFFPHPAYLGWASNFCGYSNDVILDKAYPRDALFKFIRPLNIPLIKVDEEKAKMLVKQWKERDVEQRFLAIRLYLTVTRYLGFQKLRASYNEAPVYLSYINGYEIYENLQMENKLYSKSYTVKKSKNPNAADLEDEDSEIEEKPKQKDNKEELSPEEKEVLEAY